MELNNWEKIKKRNKLEIKKMIKENRVKYRENIFKKIVW